MTKEQQRITIAITCGWKNIQQNPKTDTWFGTPPKTRKHPWDVLIPDYLTDLNAMHEAEKVLNTDELRLKYANLLVLRTEEGPDARWWIKWQAAHATAAQRAKAFLRTLNLWNEN